MLLEHDLEMCHAASVALSTGNRVVPMKSQAGSQLSRAGRFMI